ncbi:unnamed protein product [Rotaria socialis]|uniref:EGF-like domain-containing protein n=1 Tax=Rotaria socialis TaxID=392032 RepID=A0A818TMP3_9BILA|nr:unnamed protein product [Rotaria socialis]
MFTGDFDCMDRTDEYFVDRGTTCPFQANAMECDENVCSNDLYSCGDGQCVAWETRMAFQRLGKAQKDCFNKRNINYMCELSQHRPTWTNENGLCWPDKNYDDPRYPPWNMIKASNLTIDEICQYLFRCALTKGFEHDCPCNHQNCTLMMVNALLPIMDIKTLHLLIKMTDSVGMTHKHLMVAHTLFIPTYVLREECISNYRIRDGDFNCMDGDDELRQLDKTYCTGNVGRHRFQCFNNEHKCLPLQKLGSGMSDCSNGYDESWFGIGTTLRYQLPCFKRITTDCPHVMEYIHQSSSKNSSNSSLFIGHQQQESTYHMPFRYYCNTFWDSDQYIDEIPSSYKYWICQHSQYQCRTGQCIPVEWVCDGEWDCSDASDEEAFVVIENSSFHNRNLKDLSLQLEKCRKRYSTATFSKICNMSLEFGCYLSGVSNPLDIQLNRPCINLTQIGDGVENCYNAYDEKNTFISNLRGGRMWGFHFRCNNEDMTYQDVCIQGRNCSQMHCLNDQNNNRSCSGKEDFLCLHDNRCRKNVRCNGSPDCLHGEDEYWCPSGILIDITGYRISKKQISLQRDEILSQIFNPSETTLNISRHQLSEFISSRKNYEYSKVHSYQCKRGIAVIHINETRCLCPPAYYGDWCQYFNDRISIIARVEHGTQSKTISDRVFKIKANFLFNHRIIYHHEFYVFPMLERNYFIKHKFYLLYSRSSEMLAHKQKLYFNRSDVIHDHPYSIHFDVFALKGDNNLEEIGSWHYPIYFDYLPAFRLAVVLKVPSWFGNLTLNPYSKTSCNKNSICLPVFNHNNSYYCSCKSGYYGINCSMYEPICETYCSANALCRPDDFNLRTRKSSPYCICPLDHFGLRCNLKYEDCTSNPCLNNGTCFSNYDRSGENPYLCRCSSKFDGYNCENEKVTAHIYLNMTTVLHIRAVVVQFYDYDHRNLMLHILDQQIYTELPSSIISYRFNVDAPSLGILKLYEDLSHPQYFLIYFLDQQQKINITSSPQHCPHVAILLPEVSGIDPFVPSVFNDHHICRNKNLSFCFYDENYFCICQHDRYRAECFIKNIEHDRCHQCFLGGACLQGDLENPKDFICHCLPCYQGHRCEFSLQAFGFTLDSLLVSYSKKVKIVYVVIVGLLFIIGLFNNFCSFITFKRPTPRKFGVGYYLLTASCLNQIALSCLVFRFIQVTLGFVGVGSCKVISYLLSVMTRSTYWLASWITIDRLLIILFPTSSALKKNLG